MRCVPYSLGLLLGLVLWSDTSRALPADGDLAAEASRWESFAGAASAEQSAAAEKMARRVDALLAEAWRAAGVQPSARSSDAEFLRRVSLDLTGHLPTVAEASEFLNDASPDKRARLINQLLESPAHPTHLANQWRHMLLPAGFDPTQLNSVIGLQNWLRQQFADNLRYDRLVADFLVATGGEQYGPALYYTSLELQPEKLAASTAQMFLGVQLQCAECHDHPWSQWTQRDFWGYAAFFAQIEQAGGMGAGIRDLNLGEVQLPGTSETIAPKYPGGRAADADEGGTRREQLAIWMASRDNPYLPRAAVNRAWSHFFGRGLVEPVDDLRPDNPGSHPQLLEELAEYFVASGFDLRQLFRTLANTDAYQLSSRVTGEAPPPELFAAMTVRPLSSEQLYDCIRVALDAGAGNGADPMSEFLNPQRLMFLSTLQTPGGPSSEYQAGVPQVLMLMNGPVMSAATDIERSRLLAALQAPWFDDAQRVEALFLATLSRRPQGDEHSEFLEYIADAEAHGGQRAALADALWALFNSAEFALNH